MGSKQIQEFLTHLAVERNVFAEWELDFSFRSLERRKWDVKNRNSSLSLAEYCTKFLK